MVTVRKLDGTTQQFKPEKLRRSLRRSGADKQTIDMILKKVKKILHEGIETKTLYTFVMSELEKAHPVASCKYDIKSALLELGKDGRYFEQFVGELLEMKGYAVKLNQFVKGKFIPHEIDAIATKDKETLMVECKHHRRYDDGLGIQTALYVHARFLDVQTQFTKPLLVTNTTFSNQVIQYSRGVALELMGWSYPRKDSLQKNIEQFKLYPITLFKPLGKSRIRKCMDASIITIKDFLKAEPQMLSRVLGVSKKKIKEYQGMAESLCV